MDGRGGPVVSLVHFGSTNAGYNTLEGTMYFGSGGYVLGRPTSGIVTNAWYLMTFGRTNSVSKHRARCGLGVHIAEDIWYNTVDLLCEGEALLRS